MAFFGFSWILGGKVDGFQRLGTFCENQAKPLKVQQLGTKRCDQCE
jgi:hypothetical protein